MKPYWPALLQLARVSDSHDPYIMVDHPIHGVAAKIKLSAFMEKVLDAMSTELGDTANAVLRTDADGNLFLSELPIPYGTDATNTDTYVITTTPEFTSWSAGQVFFFSVTNPNTGAATIAPNGLAAKNLTTENGVPLSADMLVANQIYIGIYDGVRVKIQGIEVPEWTTVEVAISSANILGIGTTPKVLLPALAVGSYYEIESIRLEFTYGTIQYTSATATYLNVVDNNNPGGSWIGQVPVGGSDGLIEGTINTYVIFRPNNNTYYDPAFASTYSQAMFPTIPDTVILTTDDSSDLGAGDGTMRAIIKYKVHTFGA